MCMLSQSHSVTTNESRSYRVLMIAPTSFFADYGCHVRILEEARVLQKLGHRVTVVTYHNGGPVPGVDIRRTLPIPWRAEYEVGSSRHKIGFDALLGLKTFQLLAHERFDVIHAHLHEGALIGIVLGHLFGIRAVFDFKGASPAKCLIIISSRSRARAYKVFRWMERWIDHRAPIILTSTTNAERLLLDAFGCAPERICPLPDCVNNDVFKPATDYPLREFVELRAALGIPAERKIVVYLGLLAEYQGIGLLLQAMQRIVQERLTFTCF